MLVTSSASQNNFSADVTVVNPISLSQQVLSNNAARNGHASKQAELRKTQIYGPASRSLGCSFPPLALEVFGRLGDHTHKFLQTLVNQVIGNSAAVDVIASNKLYSSLMGYW